MSKIQIISPENPEGVIRDMTSEEQTLYDTDLATFQEKVNSFENEQTTKENLKASAKAKLIAGEPLTEDEANTIVL